MTEMKEMNQDAESAIMRGGVGKLRDTGLADKRYAYLTATTCYAAGEIMLRGLELLAAVPILILVPS